MKIRSSIICLLGLFIFMASCQKDIDESPSGKKPQPLIETKPLLKLIHMDSGFLYDENFSYLNGTNKLQEYITVSNLGISQKITISYDLNENIAGCTYSFYRNGAPLFVLKHEYSTNTSGKISGIKTYFNNSPQRLALCNYNTGGLLDKIEWLNMDSTVASRVEFKHDAKGNVTYECVFNGNQTKAFQNSYFSYDNKNSSYKNVRNIEVLYLIFFEYWKYIEPINDGGMLNQLQYLNPTNNMTYGIAKWLNRTMGIEGINYKYRTDNYPEIRTISSSIYDISYY
ncbi:hypothetical protein D3C80_504100 [compost metagenome]